MAKQIYVEARPPILERQALAAWILHHFQERQILGDGLVICGSPRQLRPELLKQHALQVRQLRKLRDLTDDADEKLRTTRQLIHFQSLVIGRPQSKQFQALRLSRPVDCLEVISPKIMTLYTTSTLTGSTVRSLISRLPQNCVVSSDAAQLWLKSGGRPKSVLDDAATVAWQQLTDLFEHQGIKLQSLATPHPERSARIDQALESLLDRHVAQEFLELFAAYRAVANRAAPQKRTHLREREHQTVVVLARQVKDYSGTSATPESTAQPNDAAYFLNDPGRAMWGFGQQPKFGLMDYCTPQSCLA